MSLASHIKSCRLRRCDAKFSRPKSAGFGLLEILIATVIVGVLMVAALNALGASVRANVFIANRAKGIILADELMTEILQQPFFDPESGTGIGVDSSESTATRTDFDDIDDYSNWNSSPPQDRHGNEKVEFLGWTRNVEVGFVSSDNVKGEFLSPSSTTGVKKVRVRVYYRDEVIIELQSVQTARWVDAQTNTDSTDPDPSPLINQSPQAELRANAISGESPLELKLDGA
jgi:prepilin-type N-terminal cleavage/methylation domain-containing protein